MKDKKVIQFLSFLVREYSYRDKALTSFIKELFIVNDEEIEVFTAVISHKTMVEILEVLNKAFIYLHGVTFFYEAEFQDIINDFVKKE